MKGPIRKKHTNTNLAILIREKKTNKHLQREKAYDYGYRCILNYEKTIYRLIAIKFQFLMKSDLRKHKGAKLVQENI